MLHRLQVELNEELNYRGHIQKKRRDREKPSHSQSVSEESRSGLLKPDRVNK